MGNYKKKEIFIPYQDRKIFGVAYLPEKEGKCPAIICSHGYNGRSEDFIKYGEFFASNGIVTYCYDFCGGSVNSKSSMDTDKMSVLTEVEDLEAVIKEVQGWECVDERKLFLFGGSQGGLVSALTAEEKEDDIKGMILLFPAFCIPDDWKSRYPDPNEIPKKFDFWGMTLGEGYVHAAQKLDLKERIGTYDKNVLILHGDQDAVVSLNYSLEAEKQYPHAACVIFPGEGHGFTEKGNEKVMEMVMEFIRQNEN